ncbi:MAG TPA: response regulator transcription factor [Acidimicrobiales bacterium]|nr:response regulator transcription factor [Acidimicrobiales bacterium]
MPPVDPRGRRPGRETVPVRILVVEDDEAISTSLVDGLRHAGFDATPVGTGAAALATGGHDLVLLDLGLPDMDGYDVCRALRAASDVPIIVLTARSDEVDRVLGLELGADDYVVKPFGFRELVARIRAVGRRRAPAAGPGEGGAERGAADVSEVGPLRVDRRSRRVWLGGDEVACTAKEFDLLAYLAAEPGTAHRRTDILEHVWDAHWYGPTKTLDAHVASLRRKLGDPRWIEAVRGVGFRLEAPA